MNNHNPSKYIAILFLALLTASCATTSYNPAKKYAPQALQQDFGIMRKVLETKHPSLYWYTTKDSMDNYFDMYAAQIKDSMNEVQFAWQVLAPMMEKISCGHTSLLMSKKFAKASKSVKLPAFPLYLKVWKDSMAVVGNMDRKDSIFKRGTLITSINGYPNKYLIYRMFNYLPHDAEALNINYIRLSSNFPYYHRNIFGISKHYKVEYIDSLGRQASATLPLYVPPKDTAKKDNAKKTEPKPKLPKLTREQRLKQYRNLSFDSSNRFALMELNTFNKGIIRGFLKRSFKELEKRKTGSLILDLRNNGGGRVTLSKQLSKYISREPFRLADSASAVSTGFGKMYGAKLEGGFFNGLWMALISKKMGDGRYHIRNMERHVIKPKNKNHYNGSVYILTNGPTFSASTMFINLVKGQKDITVVGEETGGGWHGNSGIVIPNVTLPNTRLRFRLPLYRVVNYQHVPHGQRTGIIPDIHIPVSYDAIKKKYDNKMVEVVNMILQNVSANK